MGEGLPCNGWPAHVRHGRDKHYYHAQRRKVLPQTPECIGCRTRLPEDCIPYHAEEYGPTLEDYWASCVPMCHRCHAMLHARFTTPNLWKGYLAQARSSQIDDSEYPLSTSIAPMLSRYRNRPDIAFVPMPTDVAEYFAALSTEEYSGPRKLATLLVLDERTGRTVEVADWTLYGRMLEGLSADERGILEGRGVAVREFLSGRISLPVNRTGTPVYRREYVRGIA